MRRAKRRTTITFEVLSAFPHCFDSYLNESLLKRAREKGIVAVHVYDLRRFSTSRYRKIDDRPFGGGPGMVIQMQPVYDAVAFVKSKIKSQKSKLRTILFSTRGKKLDAKTAKRLSKYDALILICGRYEGVDERVARHVADEEISIGDYVLSGGELPALVTIEAIARFVPGFLGKGESLEEVKGSYPVYTRPAIFTPKGAKRPWRVPKTLLSGNHAAIQKWREEM